MTETKTAERIDVEAHEAPAPNLPAIHQERRPSRPRAVAPRQCPASITRAIIQITKEIGKIQKQGYNEFQRYKYTRWEDINERLSPLLADYGLVIFTSEVSRNLIEENDKGSTLAVVFHYTVANEQGEQTEPFEKTGYARLRDQKGITDDKAGSKAATSAYKQFCVMLFGIRTDDFVESDAHSVLPKKDARDVYAKLQKEIDGQTSLVELGTWGKENAERIRVLPNDWQQILRDRYNEKRGELENQQREFAEKYDPETGEIEAASPEAVQAAAANPSPPAPTAAAAEASTELVQLDKELALAAKGGVRILETAWKLVPANAKPVLRAAFDRRHMPTARTADEMKAAAR